MSARSILHLMENLPAATGEDPKEWLKAALQNAVTLELATLPPYLTGMWSIVDTAADARGIVFGVVMEEMLHMGLAGNMLASLGGVPEIPVPTYPTQGLPGGVKPDLRVYLQGLTPTVVSDVFMMIERPENPLAKSLLYQGKSYPTVAAFYDEISAHFGMLQDSDLTAAHQLDDYGVAGQSVFLVQTVDLAQRACRLITEQGEGTTQSPFDDPTFGDELAHYYKFGEVFNERKLVQTGDKWGYTGDPVPFPKCYPMAEVPAGGYVHLSDLPAQVKADLESFDGAWTQLIDDLRGVWNPAAGGSPNDKMNSAVYGPMYAMADPAIALMKVPLSEGASRNFGPDWIYLG